MTPEQVWDWLDAGYDKSTLQHRELLTDTVLAYEPKNVLDVGCASGPDIAMLKLKAPKLHIQGIELDGGDAIKAGKLCTVKQGDLREILPTVPSKSFDVVYSNGVIMYTDAKWVHEMMRIARKAVVLSEKDPYSGFTLDSVRHLFTNTTKVTADIRQSWAQDGFIHEIKL